MLDIPRSDHSSFPSSSYETTRDVAATTSAVRTSFFQTQGVLQLVSLSRSLRHSSRPVDLSRATTKDRSSLSFTRKSRSPLRTGDAPLPQSLRVLKPARAGALQT